MNRRKTQSLVWMVALCVMVLGAKQAGGQGVFEAHGGSEPKGQIAGVAVSAPTSALLKGALVSLRLRQENEEDAGPLLTAVTGLDGRFLFSRLPAGDYELWITKSGYDPRSNARQLITLEEDEQVTQTLTKLWPAAVITGRAHDGDREPLPGVLLTAYRVRHRDGKRYLAAQGTATTDDLGEYRIFDLPAGNYVVEGSSKQPGAPPGELHYEFGPSLYPPGSDASGALAFELAWGEEKTNVDLELSPAPATLVTGVVFDEVTGSACGKCLVQALAAGTRLSGAGSPRVLTREDGAFVITGLTPGTYHLTAKTNGTLYRMASREIQVSEGIVQEELLAVGAGRAVSGYVDWGDSLPEDELEKSAAGEVSIQLIPAPDSPSGVQRTAQLQWEDRSFVLTDVQPGIYSLRVVPLPPRGYLKEVSLAGRRLAQPRIDVEDNPIRNVRLTLAFDAGVIQGTVRRGGSNGSKVPSGSVLLVPRQAETGYLARVEASYDSGGSFAFESVPPGAYRVYATATDTQSESALFADGSRHVVIRADEQIHLELPLIE